jgi:hypothetical protein
MNTMNRWGPWVLDLEPGERLARLRSLRALARILAGPRAVELCELLHQAETDPAALVPAADALDRLPAVDMRRIVGSYAGLVRPVPPARAGRPGVRARQLTNLRTAANSTWQAAA